MIKTSHLICFLCLSYLPVSNAEANAFSFALIGDLPYGVGLGKKDAQTDDLIRNLNNDRSLSWVLHVGDIKTGASLCSDAFLQDRYERFAKINAPFILTPGDNEWTDCHTPFAGSYDPLERLNFLRKLFFDNPEAKKRRKKLTIYSQPEIQTEHREFIENYYWRRDGVHFATIHIVGSLDATRDFLPISLIKRDDKHDTAVDARRKAALSWLKFVFEEARQNEAKALFIAIHANPGWDHRWEDENRPVFSYFNRALLDELKTFGQPTIVAHGDSHTFRIDKPSITGKIKSPANFLRVESFGENNNAWIKVNVDSESKSVFSFEIFEGN